MHLLFTQLHFLFWQHGRVGDQYATPNFASIIIGLIILRYGLWEEKLLIQTTYQLNLLSQTPVAEVLDQYIRLNTNLTALGSLTLDFSTPVRQAIPQNLSGS